MIGYVSLPIGDSMMNPRKNDCILMMENVNFLVRDVELESIGNRL